MLLFVFVFGYPQRFCNVTEGFSTLKRIQGSTGTRCLTHDKLGKTRLKWPLACGVEPSLLSRSGIRPRTDTAVDKTEQSLVPTAFILQRINSNNSGGHGENNRRCNQQCNRQCNRQFNRQCNRRCNRKVSSKQLTDI